jgi:hypothetical protein
MTDAERVTALRHAGLTRSTIAAILGTTVEHIQAVLANPGSAPPLPVSVGIPEVQTALDAGTLVVPGGGSSGPVAHDYVSNGDANGIFYALGTLGGGAFSNPAEGSGPVVATESGILVPWNPPPHATYLTDRDSTVNIFHSAGGGNGWAQWDFIGRKVKVREYTVRSRWDSGIALPTAFQLQGSNNGSDWTVLDDASPGFTTTDQWRHFTCDTVPTDPFRYIRLIDYTDDAFVLGEVELYGDLYG